MPRSRLPTYHEIPPLLTSAPENDRDTGLEEEQLAAGWEKRKDVHGRTYYADHYTRTTSWKPPTMSNDHSLVRPDVPYPPGWETRLDVKGRQFFIDHNTRTTTRMDPRLNRNPHQGSLPTGWEMRLARDMRVYFVDHCTKTVTWEDPRSTSKDHSGVPLEHQWLARKDAYIRNQLGQRALRGSWEITVRRSHVLDDSFLQIMSLTGEEMKSRPHVLFVGEEARGDQTLEWFRLLFQEMFMPELGFFELSQSTNPVLQINRESRWKHNYEKYFRFFGRCHALAIFHHILVDPAFVRGFSPIFGIAKLSLEDIEKVDTDLHSSLSAFMVYDPAVCKKQTFSVTETGRDGSITIIELKPFGNNIYVTEKTKEEYINAVIHYHLIGRVESQLLAFKTGLTELIPENNLTIFSEEELEFFVGGTTEINVEEWCKYTTYEGYYRTDRQIEWFWRCLRTWPKEHKRALLRFVTGTDRLPAATGFKCLKGSINSHHTIRFKIQRGSETEEPWSPDNTVIRNTLVLPPYQSYGALERGLLGAVLGPWARGHDHDYVHVHADGWYEMPCYSQSSMTLVNLPEHDFTSNSEPGRDSHLAKRFYKAPRALAEWFAVMLGKSKKIPVLDKEETRYLDDVSICDDEDLLV